METKAPAAEALPARFVEVSARLELLGHDLLALGELRRFVEQLQAERDSLRGQVAALQAENARVREERSRLLHAWGDRHISEEELDRRSREPDGVSLAELLQRLEHA